MALNEKEFDLGAIAWKKLKAPELKISDTSLGKIITNNSNNKERVEEADLEDAQIACNAIEELRTLQDKHSSQLFSKETTKDFIENIKQFKKLKTAIVQDICSNVEWYFFNENFEKFTKGLTDFIKKEFELNKKNIVHPSIFTLNYDTLLYQSLYHHNCFESGNPILIDGLHGTEKKGIREIIHKMKDHSKFEKKTEGSSYFLNLHGSILLESSKNERGGTLFCKARYNTSPKLLKNPLIILTAPKHKVESISNSPLLSEYWRLFESSLFKTDTLFLAGYAGNDTHIQDLILDWMLSSKKKIIVIEDPVYGKCYNKIKELDKKCSIKHDVIKAEIEKNILTYNDWKKHLEATSPPHSVQDA